LGEKPTTDSVATAGTMTLPTRFNFKYLPKTATSGDGYVPCDWNFIGITPSGSEQLKDVNNVGIAWVHLEGGTVYFGPQFTWGSTYFTAGAWMSTKAQPSWKNRVPDGTHPIDPFAGATSGQPFVGAGSGRLVFGCKINNAVVINNAIDYGLTSQTTYPNSDFYFMYKFGARIQIYGSNVFIANNLMPKPTKCFKYQQVTCKTDQSQGCNKVCLSNPTSTLIFDYGSSYAIDCNKTFYNVVSNKDAGYFQKNIQIIDNHIYNHNRKGIEASGWWMIVNNNKNIRDECSGNSFGTATGGDDVYGLGANWTLTLDGYLQTCPGGNGCISDNLSRALDLCGKALWVDNNLYNNTGAYPGNNGEGILAQTDGGTSSIYSWVVTNNQGPSYMAGYNISQEGALWAWNSGTGTYGTLNGGTLTDAAIVSNSSPTSATGDVLTTCPTGILVAPTQVKTNFATDKQSVTITWQDNTNEEIGFRIDKKIGTSTTWNTVVIRPRKSNGTSGNEQKWVDCNIPANEDFVYRVTAINCDNNNTGASVETAPLKRNITYATLAKQKWIEQDIKIYPNPAFSEINIDFAEEYQTKITIFDVLGRKISTEWIYSKQYHQNIEFLKKGMYFVTIQKANLTKTFSFVKM